MQQGQALQLLGAGQQQNFTSPPRRFSEASLIGRLEELGIGRPSTYASIIKLLQVPAILMINGHPCNACNTTAPQWNFFPSLQDGEEND